MILLIKNSVVKFLVQSKNKELKKIINVSRANKRKVKFNKF